MKFSKLLVLGALWLTAGSAMAEIVDGVRQKPVPATTSFVVETEVYIYNTGAKSFFTQGNSWATQASVSDEGRKMQFIARAEEGVYELKQYNWRLATDPGGAFAEGWRNVFFESETALFCDRGSQANYGFSVVDNGATFRICAASSESGINPSLNSDTYPASFVGLDVTENASNTALSPFLDATEGHYIEWAMVTPEEHEAWMELAKVYSKAQDLKSVIDEAKEKGVDVAAEETVYLNEAATIEDLEAAIDSVKAKMANAASPSNPANLSSYIVNPSYDDGKNTGWSGTTPAFGYTAAEFYEKNYNAYQDLSDIPNGVYAVGVQGFFRPGSTVDAYAKWPNGTDLNAMLYAKVGEDSLNVALVNIFEGSTNEKFGVGREYGENGAADEGQEHYVPNDMQSAAEYFKQGRYHNTILIGTNDNTLRIGLKKDDSNFGMNWTMWDNWTLSYLGDTPEAYQYWINETKKNVTDYSLLLDGVLYTESYLTTYNSVVSNASGNDFASAIEAIHSINDAAAALEKNVSLYKELQELKEEAIALGNGAFDEEYKSILAEWVEFDLADIFKYHNLTNEKLEEAIATGRQYIKDVKDRPTGNSDVTSYLTNPDFSTNNWNGWTKEAASGGNVAVSNSCAEAWNNSSFDIYQTYEGAPVGVYEISVQGFYRYGRGDNAWNKYQAQEDSYVKPNGAPVYVYLNAKKTPFKNVFDEPGQAEEFYSSVGGDTHNCYVAEDGGYYPDGMASAAVAFDAGYYTQTAYGLVKEGDPLRIGVKGSSNQLGDSWVIFDNFKLTYKGYDAQAIGEVLAEELEKASELLKSDMGKTAYASLSKAIADANAAIQANNGKAMFDALNSLFEAEDEVNASIKKFADLAAAMENFNQEIEASNNSTAKTDASILYETIQTKLGNHEIDESELDGLYEQINNMITKLRMPDYASAADTNPIDFTNVITNAHYNENADGWTTEAKVGYSADGANAEIFGQAYDYYQEFSGLPAGTYRVAVQAFYRAGGAKEDYADYIGENVNNNAYLYAEGTSPVSQAVSRLSSYVMEVQDTEGWTNDANPSSWAVAEDQDLGDDVHNYILVCNNMSNAADLFGNGEQYGGDPILGTGNVVTVKVGDDGKLRLGLKKLKEMDNDWTIFDEWQLWYFGANSQLTISGDPYTEGIEEVLDLNDVVKSEYFTIDGRKATAVQKGIIIQKMTLVNGAVVVKKIRK